MYGIEILALAVLTLFMPYIFLGIELGLEIIILIVIYYYLAKTIFILKHHANRYRKIMSDIKEIIKKEPKKREKLTT